MAASALCFQSLKHTGDNGSRYPAATSFKSRDRGGLLAWTYLGKFRANSVCQSRFCKVLLFKCQDWGRLLAWTYLGKFRANSVCHWSHWSRPLVTRSLRRTLLMEPLCMTCAHSNRLGFRV